MPLYNRPALEPALSAFPPTPCDVRLGPRRRASRLSPPDTLALPPRGRDHAARHGMRINSSARVTTRLSSDIAVTGSDRSRRFRGFRIVNKGRRPFICRTRSGGAGLKRRQAVALCGVCELSVVALLLFRRSSVVFVFNLGIAPISQSSSTER